MISRCLLWSSLAVLSVASSSIGQAQIAPGVRLPDNVAEGILMAQLFGCVGAVSERPANGLNVPLEAGLTGVAMHDALPEPFVSKVGPLGGNSRIMSLEAPDGRVWMAYDPDTRRCFVTARTTSSALIREQVLPLFESDESPWQATEPLQVAGETRTLPRFEWQVRATPRLGTPAVRLRATIDIPDTADQQTLIVTEAVGD